MNEVYMICDAYEAGYGKGYAFSKDQNPYKQGSSEWEAWDIGYRNGASQWANKLEATGGTGT